MIKYRRATERKDYAMAEALAGNEGIAYTELGFPTLLAFDGKKLIGFCTTRVVDNMVVAGPLLLKSDRKRAFTALELCVRYEEELRSLGITSYIFSAEKGSVMEEAVNRYMHGMEAYAEDEDNKFYVRRLDQDQGASLVRGPIGETHGRLVS